MTNWEILIVGLAMVATVGLLLYARSEQRRHRRRAAAAEEIAATGPDTTDPTDTTNATDTTHATDNEPSPDWVWTVDPAGLFTSSSPSSLDQIGYSPDELIGREVGLILDQREFARAGSIVNALGVSDPRLSELVISCRHQDGSTRWFEVSLQTESDPDGTVIGYQGRCRMIGPEAAEVVAAQHIRTRIEAIMAGRLLMTAFQPIVDLTSHKVIGAEALSRFVAEPGRTPDVWFTDAAGVGLGAELELLAIDIALRAAHDLPEHLYVSINVSPSTCLDDRLSDLIMGSAIDPGRIVLELTEHSGVSNYEPLNDVLAGMRRAGVRIAIDDAGAGFASGQHILKIRPDIIKLDRSLVTAIDTDSGERALAASMVAFASYLGAKVTAEGIETRAELRCVTALGVTAGQGYLLGRASVTPRVWARWKLSAPLRRIATSEPAQLVIARSAGSVLSKPIVRGEPNGTPGPNQTARKSTDQDAVGAGGGPIDEGARASTADPAPTPAFALAVLDALPDATAILDSSGRIIAVNKAWRMFTQDNGGHRADTGVGVSYLDVCARASAAGNPDAAEVFAGLRAVLDGDAVEHEWEYACSSPSVLRWFVSKITAIGGPDGGVVVSHANISRRKRSEQELEHRASHDPLTGLANRILFTDVLTAALYRRPGREQPANVGLLYIDLDDFKLVNDAHGHAAGDELLLIATHRLSARVRAGDTVARIGGDEFAACAPWITADDLAAMAARIGAALAKPHQIHGQQVHLSASIGMHLAAPGDPVADVLHRADQALSAVKGERARPQIRPVP